MKPGALPDIANLSKEERDIWYKNHLKEWEEVCSTELFQWLKHGEGRMVLDLLAEGKISIGKAAQTIATVFVLKREETIPCIYCEHSGNESCVLCKGTGLVVLEPEKGQTQCKSEK